MKRKHTSDSPDTLDGSSTIYQPEIEADSFKVGSLFADRYEILSEGRKGGMGTVYKCKDTKLEEIVALKVIHPKLLSSTQAVSRFRQEVALSRKLQHPNIVRVYNLEEWQDKEYFTMEWVEGVTLREILNKRKKQNEPFTLIEAGNIISQLSDALHYAHAHMVHRDIKPENILVETDEDKDEVQKDLTNIKIRLTDFGIAKMLSSSRFTMSSMQMGTPYYMAPEQKTDARVVDKRADIYASGVVLFELLTLENTIGLKLPTELNNELPKEIDNIIKKALEPSPRDRYEDINNLSDDVGMIVAVEDSPALAKAFEEKFKSLSAEKQEQLYKEMIANKDKSTKVMQEMFNKTLEKLGFSKILKQMKEHKLRLGSSSDRVRGWITKRLEQERSRRDAEVSYKNKLREERKRELRERKEKNEEEKLKRREAEEKKQEQERSCREGEEHKQREERGWIHPLEQERIRRDAEVSYKNKLREERKRELRERKEKNKDEKLKALPKLKDEGLISQEKFEAKKAEVSYKNKLREEIKRELRERVWEGWEREEKNKDEKLKALQKLKDEGLISQKKFEAKKAEVNYKHKLREERKRFMSGS